MTNKARSREERTRGAGADLVDPPARPKTKIQRTRGRPSDYEPEMVAHASYLASTGYTMQEIADEMGVSRTSVWNWQQQYPEFMNAIKKARDAQDDRVEEALRINAVINHNPTAQIFWLKNRRPQTWRDRKEHELVVPDNSQQPEDADTRQLALAALALMQEAAYDADLMIEGTANAEENADGVNQPRRAHQEPESAGLDGDPDFDEAFELDE